MKPRQPSASDPGRKRSHLRGQHRAIEGALLATAVVFAVVFVAALAYTVYAFFFAMSKGFEQTVGPLTTAAAILLPISLCIAVVAAILLARVELRRRRRGHCGRAGQATGRSD